MGARVAVVSALPNPIRADHHLGGLAPAGCRHGRDLSYGSETGGSAPKVDNLITVGPTEVGDRRGRR
jgi:hypothetical protein